MTNLREVPIIDRRSSVADLEEASVAALHLLADRGTLPAEEIPGDQMARDAVRAVFTDRGNGGLRMRAKLAGDTDGAARALHGVLKWHQSGGDLHGLFYARMAGGDAYDRMETLALVIRVVAGSGGDSPAVAAWRRTGLV